MKYTFATLYKKDSKKKIRQWTIVVDNNEIHTTFGELDGKLQTTVDVISEGKNLGKINETTPSEQAYAEALSKWEKQLKKGYVDNLKDAQGGKIDEQYIEGGINPMLAHKFTDYGDRLKFPVLVSPKLDGVRCVAIIKDGKATLWTRNRKPITGVPHVVKELEKMFPTQDIILDGELYNHDYKNNFEQIISFVRSETPKEGHEVVQYHVFDIVNDEPFISRCRDISNLIDQRSDIVVRVKNEVAGDSTYTSEKNEQELMECYQKFRGEGYEGAMVRDPQSKYENKRSRSLLKMKEFLDEEFEIVGAELGRGKLSDAVAAFVCVTKQGSEFRVKMEGSYDTLREFAKNETLWKNKLLTVCYQNLTEDGIPRFPIGKAIRDDC